MDWGDFIDLKKDTLENNGSTLEFYSQETLLKI